MRVLLPDPTVTTPEAGSGNFVGEKGRATAEPGLSRSDGARGALVARCSRPSHVGLILLKDLDLLDERAPLEESVV